MMPRSMQLHFIASLSVCSIVFKEYDIIKICEVNNTYYRKDAVYSLNS
jgi:hypothetical protein